MLLSAYDTQAVAFLRLLLSIVGITTLASADSQWLYHRSNGVVIQPARSQLAGFGVLQPQPQWQPIYKSYNNYHQQQNNPPGFRAGLAQPQHPLNGQRILNQAPHQYFPYGHQANFNQTSTSWQQPQISNHSQHSFVFNHTRPQPFASNTANYSQYPAYVQQQRALNQTHPVRHEQLPNYPAQTSNLYPKQHALNLPQTPNSGPPLAALAPKSPTSWRSGHQAAISYGPRYNPSP